MDPIVRRGFAIGLVVAVIAGFFAWRQGWLTASSVPSAIDVAVVPKPPAPAKPDETSKNSLSPKADRTAPPPAAAQAPASPQGGVAALSPSVPGGTPKPEASAEKGAFDVVRVEPSGETVVAGRCPAGCTVELLANGKPQDKAVADPSGAFAMVPKALAPGDHVLALRVTTPDGKQATSDQSVTVSVPSAPSGEVVVVLNEPNAPSKILQRPGQAPASAAADEPGRQAARSGAGPGPSAPKTPAQKVAALSLGAVDAEAGRFFVQGSAPSGSRLRVYLNNSLIAEPVTGADERWSVRVERGLSPGRYVARVDHVDPTTGKVISRAEASFAHEASVAATTPRAAAEAVARLPEGGKPPAAARTASPPVEAAAGERAKGAVDGRTTYFGGATGAQSPRTGSEDSGSAVSPAEPAARAEPTSQERSAATIQAPQVSPSAPDASPPSAPASPFDAPADAANPVVASIDTAQVRRGDSLWRISRSTYGAGHRYTIIFTANDEQIRNPNLIYPGQVLVLPGPGEADGRR